MFNALVHQYLIPGMQVGAKVSVDTETGIIGDIFAVARPVLPYAGGGCLLCNGLIPADKLQQEALTVEERRAQAYVEEAHVTAPSVITLNAVACAQAANEFLLGYFGLLNENNPVGYQMQFCREKKWQHVIPTQNAKCLHCGHHHLSTLARGDGAILPCRSN